MRFVKVVGVMSVVLIMGGNVLAKADSANVVQTQKHIVKESTLLFFMNPNGRPCQIQDEILQSVKGTIDSLVNVQYIKTTISQDQAEFYKYGIRSIPLLIVVDKKGKEIKRFTPGIHEQDKLIAALKKL
ncbi:MAG: thioredoxin family protein [Fibrobacter sp.]|nr:thioredoxin family protein [Fibrobacter sp.]